MLAPNRALGLVSILCAMAMAACAPSSGPVAADGPAMEENEGPRQLVLLGEAFRTVTEGNEIEIGVRYLRDNGAVIPGGLVEFGAEGDTGGGSLSANTVQTDDTGLATVILRAGMPARVIVTATAEGVEQPVSAIVDVITPSFGDLQVTVSYGGGRPVRTIEMGLFTNTTCDAVVERAPTASDARSTRPGASVTFESVEVGVPMAVFALGIDNNDFVAADGCLDVTLEDPNRVAELIIDDIPETLGGAYDVVERFDVTAGTHPTLDGLLGAMTGLSSDPAQFIVGFVASSESTPDWLRSAIGNPVMAALVTSTLRGAIEGVEVPGLLVETVDLGADLDHALSGLELTGELVIEEPDEFGAAEATHRISRMRVPVDGAIETRSVRAEADLSMPITPEMTMPTHSLEVAFGTLVETILEEILLPRLPGSPDSMRGLMTQIFDCADIAEWLVGDDSLAADLANAVCDAGVVMLANEVEEYVEDLFEYDALVLQGTALLTDTDDDYDRDGISSGHLQADWAGADGELTFSGTMTGTLRDDAAGRQHPVRDRIRPLI